MPHPASPQRRALVQRLALLAAAGGGATLLPQVARGQAYPSRPIRVVVPYPAGGNTDLTMREIMKELATALSQPVVIDNRVGANSIIGTDNVAKSPPDGYSLLTVLGAFAINPSIYKRLPYTPDQLAPVSLIGRTNLIVSVGTQVPVKSFAELVAYGKSGAQVTFDSSGIGSALHLAGEQISRVTGMRAIHVPYKGIAQSLPDIVAGRVTFTLNAISSLKPYFDEGRLVPLVVLGKARLPQLPKVPTIVEAGYPQLESYGWQGLVVPARTPRPIVDQLSRQIAAILRRPDLRNRLIAMGLDPIGSTPAEFASFIEDDMTKAAAIVKQAGIVAE